MTPLSGNNHMLGKISLVVWLYIVLTVGLSGLLLYIWFWQDSPTYTPPPSRNLIYGSGCLKIDSDEQGCRVTLEIADDDQERIKGLSGRESMAPDRGMLFVSDAVETQCFWMKDMNFSLDLVWLDEEKSVTKIVENLSPDTYPQQFCSDIPDKYVIELSAGSVDRLGIATGKTLYY